MSGQNSISGKTIVVTRPKEHSEEFSLLLKNAGAEVILFPTIEFAPLLPDDEYDAAIKNLQQYDGFIFTSASAVEYFFRNLQKYHLEIIKQKPVYVVGEKTNAPLIKAGITSLFLPNVYDVQHLAESILKSVVSGKQFLHPKGNLAGATIKTELEKSGASVDEVIVYQTIKPNISDAKTIEELLIQRKIDVITFFSTSSVVHCLEMIPRESLSSTIIAVNGKTTAESARQSGLHVKIIADQPTSEGVVNAIKKYYAKPDAII